MIIENIKYFKDYFYFNEENIKQGPFASKEELEESLKNYFKLEVEKGEKTKKEIEGYLSSERYYYSDEEGKEQGPIDAISLDINIKKISTSMSRKLKTIEKNEIKTIEKQEIEKEYYILDENDKKYGPFKKELLNQKITPNTFVAEKTKRGIKLNWEQAKYLRDFKNDFVFFTEQDNISKEVCSQLQLEKIKANIEEEKIKLDKVNKKYFVLDENDEKYGPFSKKQLNNKINKNTFVILNIKRDDYTETELKKAKDIDDFKSDFVFLADGDFNIGIGKAVKLEKPKTYLGLSIVSKLFFDFLGIGLIALIYSILCGYYWKRGEKEKAYYFSKHVRPLNALAIFFGSCMALLVFLLLFY